MNKPRSSPENELLGTEFYPEFSSTEAARSLEVSAVDAESGSLKRFIVTSNGDLWRIPTHYDYPAEAAARIAETSASVMGLERQALVGRSESEFEKFGVVDPLSEDIEDPETVGTRITLKDSNSEILVDYIIGDEIEVEPANARRSQDFNEQTPRNDFYIRRAEDSQTYRVSLDVDLSTRFSDWIDPDLLRISQNDVTFISIDNYKIEERGAGAFGRIKQLFKNDGDKISMRRSSPAAKWSIGDIHPTNEEVNLERINEILGVLDQMKIVGVRPKFKFNGKQLLSADLELAEIPELDSDAEKKSYAIQALQSDLAEKGFNFGGTQEKLELLSENGELEFGTTGGLRFRLHVGAVVSGDDQAIEIGTTAGDGESTNESDLESDESAEDKKSGDESNRFLFVRVSFDEELLDDKPVEPTMPEEPSKPEGYVAFVAPQTPGESAGDDAQSDESETSTGDDDEKAEPVDDRDPKFIAYDKAMKEYETAKSEHEMDLTRFKQDTEAFEEKVEEGKALVKELNERFGDWFYVISAENLKTIQSKREDLVKFVEPEEGEEATPKKPDISFPELPSNATTFGAEEKKEASKADGEDASAESKDLDKSVSDETNKSTGSANSGKVEPAEDSGATRDKKAKGDDESSNADAGASGEQKAVAEKGKSESDSQ